MEKELMAGVPINPLTLIEGEGPFDDVEMQLFALFVQGAGISAKKGEKIFLTKNHVRLFERALDTIRKGVKEYETPQ